MLDPYFEAAVSKGLSLRWGMHHCLHVSVSNAIKSCECNTLSYLIHDFEAVGGSAVDHDWARSP